MRFVDRSSVPPPQILSSPAVAKGKADIQRILRLGDEKRQQVRSKVDYKLLRHPEIKAAFAGLFHNKCAYCETPIEPDRWDLDQLRPIGSAAQLDGRTHLHFYAWLAYEWGNLYPACADCNRTKRNRFPVTGERAPLNTSLEKIYRLERGTIVDPCNDRPHEHFMFDSNGVVSAESERGAVSIEVLDLNRPKLVAERAAAFTHLSSAFVHSDLTRLKMLVAPREPYSGAMSIRLFKVWHEVGPRIGLPPGDFSRLVPTLPRLVELAHRSRTGEFYWDTKLSKARRKRRRRTVKTTDTVEQRNGRASTSRLASIELQNFKAIRRLTLSLPEKIEDQDGAPCLVLLGENATGKSSILEAIALALLGTNHAKHLKLDARDFARRTGRDAWKRPSRLPVAVKVGFHGLDSPVKLALKPGAHRFVGERVPATVILAYGPHRYFSKTETRRPSAAWGRIETLFSPLSAIPNPVRWLERADPDRFAAVVRALREILLLSTDDDLVRDNKRHVQIKTHRHLTPLDRLSEGYRAMLALAVDIMREMLDHWDGLEQARGIVLIDEIETHLHPRWKMRVMAAMRSAMPHVQFIVTTHDPLCLRGMSHGEVVVLNRSGDEIDQLEDLPDVRGLRAEQLLTSNYFGLSSTSDPQMETDLGSYEKLLAAGPRARRENAAELERVRERLAKRTVIGDTAQDQVVQEAVGRYLSERKSAPAPARRASHRRAINAVLAALNRRSRGAR